MDDEGLAIIDQHVAHERILFEQIAARLARGPLESQRLLTPVVLDAGAGGAPDPAVARGRAGACSASIWPISAAPASSVAGVPALLDWTQCEAALRAVSRDLDGLATGAGVEEALRQLAATMACHAAVKANDLLTPREDAVPARRTAAHRALVVCPHGRPVVLRLTRREIEQSFDRV